MIDQIDHDIVSGTDRSGNRCLSRFDQNLCISKPHIRSVGQTGNTDQIRKRLRIGILYHLDYEICTEFRDSKASQITAVNILRFDSQCTGIVKQRKYFFIIQRNLCRIKRILVIVLILQRIRCNVLLQSTDHGRIIMPQNVKFQKVVVNGMVIKMSRNNIRSHIICRVLYRCKLIDVMPVRQYHNSSRMLSRTPSDPRTSL